MNKIILFWFLLLVSSASVFATIREVNSESGLRDLSVCSNTDTITLKRDVRMSNESFSPLCPGGFRGVFDGGGHTISNLHISANMKHEKNIAFIAVLGESGVLRNLIFDNPTVTAEQNGNGGVLSASVAVAVGDLQGGLVENVHVISGTVSVQEGKNATGINAGGLVGTAESGNISESGGAIDVSHEGTGSVVVGGICGNVTGDVAFTSVTYDGDAPIAGATSNSNGISIRYGAITVNEKNSLKTAVIDGNYTEADTVKIPFDIMVNSVTLDRTFTQNVLSSIMLPFSISASKIGGATKIYKFNRVAQSDGIWKVKVGVVTDLVANTPYMVLPSANGQLTFNLDEPVNFNTTTGPETKSVVNGTWEFVGVYAYTYFGADFPDVDRVYGFAAEEANGFKPGDFVKAGIGADIPAMRAYLIHHRSSTPAYARALTKSAAGFNHGSALPDVIEIEVEDEDGTTLVMGKLNALTGEVSMDQWFDLKGRKLKARPTAPGNYYLKGKREIVK